MSARRRYERYARYDDEIIRTEHTMHTKSQDVGNLDAICTFCDGSVNVPRNIDGHDKPETMSTTDFHASAKCVEGDEPSLRMGGPR